MMGQVGTVEAVYQLWVRYGGYNNFCGAGNEGQNPASAALHRYGVVIWEAEGAAG